MDTKTVKHYIDNSLGFPVQLSDVTFVKVRDEWVPKLDYPRMKGGVLSVLSRLHRPLTGHEVKFVRLHFGLTQIGFGEIFGISGPAVHKWERRGDRSTDMQWSTEKDLRLFIQSKISTDALAVGKLYEELTARPGTQRKSKPSAPERIELGVSPYRPKTSQARLFSDRNAFVLSENLADGYLKKARRQGH